MASHVGRHREGEAYKRHGGEEEVIVGIER